eukprot:26832-Eustigmatos_ZCMA.PRE.1
MSSLDMLRLKLRPKRDPNGRLVMRARAAWPDIGRVQRPWNRAQFGTSCTVPSCKQLHSALWQRPQVQSRADSTSSHTLSYPCFHTSCLILASRGSRKH